MTTKTTQIADEALPNENTTTEEEGLQKIDLESTNSISETEVKKSESADEIERREFTRVDVTERKLELRFSHGAQFAKQYIENISLGGLFIKTDTKAPMGSTLSIDFSVPNAMGESHHFHLKAKVCRVTERGLGLEFLDVPSHLRVELEKFVQSVLPPGRSVHAKPKQSSIENLDRLREEKHKQAIKQRKFAIQLGVAVALIILNFFFLRARFEAPHYQEALRRGHLLVNGKKIEYENIRTVSRDPQGRLILTLDGNSSVSVDPKAIQNQLPYYLEQTVHLLESTPAITLPRHSQTSRYASPAAARK